MSLKRQIKQAEVINDMAYEVNQIAREKGFWAEDSFYIIPTKLALIADEVSETLQVHRAEYDGDDNPDSNMTPRQEQDFCEELADIVVRTLDLAQQYDFDIGFSITEKIEKNRERPRKHGRRY